MRTPTALFVFVASLKAVIRSGDLSADHVKMIGTGDFSTGSMGTVDGGILQVAANLVNRFYRTPADRINVIAAVREATFVGLADAKWLTEALIAVKDAGLLDALRHHLGEVGTQPSSYELDGRLKDRLTAA
jgi:hypothetical protein